MGGYGDIYYYHLILLITPNIYSEGSIVLRPPQRCGLICSDSMYCSVPQPSHLQQTSSRYLDICWISDENSPIHCKDSRRGHGQRNSPLPHPRPTMSTHPPADAAPSTASLAASTLPSPAMSSSAPASSRRSRNTMSSATVCKNRSLPLSSDAALRWWG